LEKGEIYHDYPPPKNIYSNSGFYKIYKKITPKFIQAVIRPFWRGIGIPCQMILNSRLCLKMQVNWKRNDFVYKALDYVRYSSLELAAREIYENNIGGNVAELGVYQGNFAKYINKVFPERKLYLFDTFEGFSENDMNIEKQIREFEKTEYFKNTNIDIVLSKMENKENCIIRKGYFPESAEGIDDTFAFVNIDVDLFEPIYNGLSYFYPRLNKGGYIFVHDYNNKHWTGAKEGVKKFSREKGIAYFPLSDTGGSVIFMK
jgi:O-methyltransferase